MIKLIVVHPFDFFRDPNGFNYAAGERSTKHDGRLRRPFNSANGSEHPSSISKQQTHFTESYTDITEKRVGQYYLSGDFRTFG